ncbi:uncharacterized protein CCR75_005766 [Bremia lactucae]|uniref:Uncharacterized protein n=1 Tax=Bremia lactucae TaxID=4779 RepID=A0A976FH02_BRELC|nr:hypothetical protein CCR75_005766 [Bremia lactucae]
MDKRPSCSTAAVPRGLAVPDLYMELLAPTASTWAIRATPEQMVVGDIMAAHRAGRTYHAGTSYRSRNTHRNHDHRWASRFLQLSQKVFCCIRGPATQPGQARKKIRAYRFVSFRRHL